MGARHDTVSTVIETITPARAAGYLKFNTDNRHVRKRWVSDLAAMMRRGEWMTSHQGIAFAADGRLIDGQHRLMAVVEADLPVTMQVTRGLDPEVFSVTDRHARRSLADALHLSPRSLEPVKFLAQVHHPHREYTAQLIEPYVDKLYPLADELTRSCTVTRRTYATAPVRAAVMIRCLENPLLRDTFFAKYTALVTGRTEDFTAVMHVYFRQTIESKFPGYSGTRKLFAMSYLAMSTRPFNANRIIIQNDGAKQIEAAIIQLEKLGL